MKTLIGGTTHVKMHFNKLRDLNSLIFSSSRLPSKDIPGVVLPPSGQFVYSLTKSVGIIFMFKFNDKLKSFVINLQSQIAKLTCGHRYVALHLRTGKFKDYLSLVLNITQPTWLTGL